MAQFDLIFVQNTHATGVEFTERFLNIGKGGLISQNGSGVPTILAAGTDGYMLVADSAQVTGLRWAVVTSHTQNTDTGTTGLVFALDSDGYDIELTAESAAKFGVKVAGGATYADIQAKDATFASVSVSAAPTLGSHLTNKTYVDGLLASSDAMIFKGTVGVGGTYEIAAFNALATYNTGWTFRVITAGTVKGKVCEVGDLVMCLVDRAGSGNVDADWTVAQTNVDGAVTGPASVTSGYLCVFSGTTGKVIAAGTGAPGTMAYETATNYVAKSTYTANSIVYATTSATPLALTVGASTIVGRKATGGIVALTAAETKTILAIAVADISDIATNYVAKSIYTAHTILYATTSATPVALTIGINQMVGRIAGNIVALSGTDVMNNIWQTAPATKTSTGTLGMVAKDLNYFYICVATNVWVRTSMATNW